MILKSIKLNNFRSYFGFHEIDVSPTSSGRKEKPVILFGGLNGAGKTSILTAVKLALYGKYSLGTAVAQKKYEEYLQECMHIQKQSDLSQASSSVGLCFSFDKEGTLVEYEICRSWEKSKNGCIENLSIFENNVELKSLKDKDAENYLNQLVPLGVSDLFFFDGEKIAELAEDESGIALGAAIKKLLGIDLVDRLRADLRVFLLSNTLGGHEGVERQRLIDDEKAFSDLKQRIIGEKLELEGLMQKYDAFTKERETLELQLSEIGGDYAKSRQEQQLLAEKLNDKVGLANRELRENLTNLFPLTLAQELLQELSSGVEEVVDREKKIAKNRVLQDFSDRLLSKISLKDKDLKLAKKTLSESLEKIFVGPKFYPETNQSEMNYIDGLVKVDVPNALTKIGELSENIEVLQQDLEVAALKVERAPDERSLELHLSKIYKVSEKAHEVKAEIKVRAAEISVLFNRTIELSRALTRGHETLNKKIGLSEPLEHAVKARELMLEFSELRVASKVIELQEAFLKSFDLLMRKKGSIASAKIDPVTFSVELFSFSGEQLNKNKLSAGEKQIYAIAMLDSLAKTSGNHLPIIIDTPLGRLDSKHRAKLVNDYFPSASHQVLLLSTDTEIDEGHYKKLAKFCAKKLEIIFDEKKGRSSVVDGYFFASKSGSKA